MFYMHLYAILYDFWDKPINLEPSASFCFLLVFEFCRKGIPNGVELTCQFLMFFMDQKKTTEHRSWARRVPSCPRGWRARPPPWAWALASWTTWEPP